MINTSAKQGIILMNLGSPDSTEVKDVRRYLMEFLMDGRVIDYPYPWRLLLVGGIIVPFRAPKSAAAYRSIWTEGGSPLIVITQQLQEAVQQQMEAPVEIAMRYGNPSVATAYNNLMKRLPSLEEVIAVPLYPHFAMSSYETAVEHAKTIHKKGKYPFSLSFIKPFYNEPNYLQAMEESIIPYLQQDYDHILFSYHGVPQRHIHKSDITGNHCLKTENCCQTDSPAHAFCYRHQCFETTRLLTQKLNIPESRYSISFQSRLGKGWLEPFTDIRLAELPKEGKKKIAVLCPAFVSDCLETLEEIAVEGKETFLHAGGESFTFIPCINTDAAWVNTITSWMKAYAKGERSMILQ
ncbi:ferrochelatase [Agriterribacter sp.]|uniref:ferrochelatase n=1 Tax=Agriterribacter sp. TaxID=2821509 RepID=UPI002C94DE93|nr:ferrochelatase [Agriterribacter sp.]HRO44458.1 ferrochelatase [Agriterribacter sp.]HRQ16515.1 ferrochelatase [Agriterribacter sp.]